MREFPHYKLLLIVLLCAFNACNNKDHNTKVNSQSQTKLYQIQHYSTSTHEQDIDEESDEDSNEDKTDPQIEDGNHNATVDYYNPNTGYSATYTLDVEVEDGKVRQINWPNGGWSDEDHITPGELGEDGNVTIDGEDGQTYDVQIDD
ncbi:MAG: hypothetical protein KA149_07840 [Chitinophagales bacterium]|nr:hypothetical protein [Chitinophagales bacterium]